MKTNWLLIGFLVSICIGASWPAFAQLSVEKEYDEIFGMKIAEPITFARVASHSGNLFMLEMPESKIIGGQLVKGTIISFTSAFTNTGPTSVVISNGKTSTKPTPVYKEGKMPLAAMDIFAARWIWMIFNGEQFNLVNTASDITNILSDCDSLYVNLSNDLNNCGSCGIVCPPGEQCLDGKCRTECPTGQMLCGSSCIDLAFNEKNCGSCGNNCPPGTICENGQCISGCPSGKTKCNGDCADLKRDTQNCGTCGNDCLPGFICHNGKCQIACPKGLENCNLNCVNLKTDSKNCGNCGVICPPGYTCKDGACIVVCAPGQKLCNGDCIDTFTNNTNCGDCGRTCPPNQQCVQGRCQ